MGMTSAAIMTDFLVKGYFNLTLGGYFDQAPTHLLVKWNLTSYVRLCHDRTSNHLDSVQMLSTTQEGQ